MALLTWWIFVLWPAIAFADPVFFDADDGTPYEFPETSKTVVVGDLHADFAAFVSILRHRDLIDPQGRWKGGDTRLVLMGDLINRGPNSRILLDYVRSLQAEAGSVGGGVHVLLGNHEYAAVLHRKELSEVEPDYRGLISLQGQHGIVQYFRKLLKEGKDSTAPQEFGAELPVLERDFHQEIEREASREAMQSPDSPYYQEIISRNTVLKVGPHLFVHAGLGDVLEGLSKQDLGRLNSTVRNTLRAGNFEARLPWIDSRRDGLLYGGDFAFNEMPEEKVDSILSGLGCERCFMGHITTASGRVEMGYQGKRISVDTGNSEDGIPREKPVPRGISAVEILKGKAPVAYDNIPRLDRSDPLVKEIELRHPVIPRASLVSFADLVAEVNQKKRTFRKCVTPLRLLLKRRF